MIDLSRCADFDLGAASVRPSSREVVSGKKSEIIEPKVMQVLVTLAEQPGRVVSRDALVEKCWGARIVGEDAINRVIGKVRRAADSTGAFRIETVARVGYRLSVTSPQEVVAPLGPPAAAIRAGPRRAWIGWAMTAIAVVVMAFLIVKRPRQRQIVAAVAGKPLAAADAPLPKAVSDLETRGLSAMFENKPERTAEGVAYLRQATALAPRAAPIWGSLAMSYILSLGWVPPGDRGATALRVRDAAAHALAIDAHESRSVAALVSLEPTFGHWQSKAAALRAARKQARSEMGPLLYQEIQFLMAVGRTREALPLAERLALYSPLVPWIQAARIDLLVANGRLEDADRAARDAFAIWPRDRLTWFTSFDLAAYNGEPERALAMAANRQGWPGNTDPAEVVLAERLVRAMTSHDRAEADHVLLAFRSLAPRGQAYTERAMRAALALGRPAMALEFAERLYSGRLAANPRQTMLPRIGFDGDDERPTAALFLPPAQALWNEPGFMPLMKRIGLADYWRSTEWPDFCRTPSMAKRCRAMQPSH